MKSKGFTHEVSLSDLGQLPRTGRKYPSFRFRQRQFDPAFKPMGLPEESTVRQVLEQGAADLVSFSGDKTGRRAPEPAFLAGRGTS